MVTDADRHRERREFPRCDRIIALWAELWQSRRHSARRRQLSDREVGALRPQLSLRRRACAGPGDHAADLSGHANALHHRSQHLRQPAGRQLRHDLATGNAFIYDISTGAYTTNNIPGAISTTAYGIYGDKIAGGYGEIRGSAASSMRSTATSTTRRPEPTTPTITRAPSPPISRASPAPAEPTNTISSPTGWPSTGPSIRRSCMSTPWDG